MRLMKVGGKLEMRVRLTLVHHTPHDPFWRLAPGDRAPYLYMAALGRPMMLSSRSACCGRAPSGSMPICSFAALRAAAIGSPAGSTNSALISAIFSARDNEVAGTAVWPLLLPAAGGGGRGDVRACGDEAAATTCERG